MLLTQDMQPSYYLIVHCFTVHAFPVKHIYHFFVLFRDFFGLLLFQKLIEALISSFLIARKQISPFNFSHLTVFSVDHIEVPSIINGKRKVE